MEEFPSNSFASREPGKQEEKKIERVTSTDPTRRRKSLRKQFHETFLAGDARSAMQYVIFGVLIPAAKDALAEAGSQGIERLIFGESRRSRGIARPGGPTGYVSYNRYSMSDKPPLPLMSRRARVRHDFDEIVLESRVEAEEVIDRLFDLCSRYGTATVGDLYELTGIQGTHTDQKWGWTDLRGSGVSRVRNGYLLDLPEPEPLTN